MSAKDNSEPAFPCTGEVIAFKQGEPCFGMSMRDYFAAQALAGWLSSFGEDMPHPADQNREHATAEQAYKMADAMIEARKGEG